jgi:hypothetical protein
MGKGIGLARLLESSGDSFQRDLVVLLRHPTQASRSGRWQ